MLNACASLVVIEEGRCVHQQIIQISLESDVFVGSSLDMYAKSGGCLESVQQDAILRCGNLDHHTWRMHNALAW
jgi:hypothetical protein